MPAHKPSRKRLPRRFQRFAEIVQPLNFGAFLWSLITPGLIAALAIYTRPPKIAHNMSA